MVAYACRIVRENFHAIASEKPDFDIDELYEWLDEHKTGYFLRDISSPFDCKYVPDDLFFQIYIFERADTGELFRRILMI
jgi:hypothetical protein